MTCLRLLYRNLGKRFLLDIVFKIVEIRKQYPNFSKNKIKHILENVYSIKLSYSTIGRILKKKVKRKVTKEEELA